MHACQNSCQSVEIIQDGGRPPSFNSWLPHRLANCTRIELLYLWQADNWLLWVNLRTNFLCFKQEHFIRNISWSQLRSNHSYNYFQSPFGQRQNMRNADITFSWPSFDRIVDNLFNVHCWSFITSLPQSPILWKYTRCLWMWSFSPILHHKSIYLLAWKRVLKMLYGSNERPLRVQLKLRLALANIECDPRSNDNLRVSHFFCHANNVQFCRFPVVQFFYVIWIQQRRSMRR